VWCFVDHCLSLAFCVVLCIALFDSCFLCGVKQGTNNDLQNTTQKARDKQWSTKHHTENKGQTMIYKAPHRKQGTNNDLQNTTQKARDKQWSTKHHAESKWQTMIYKTPHRKQKIKQHELQWNMGWITEELAVPSSTSDIRSATVKQHEHYRRVHHNTELKLEAVLLTSHFVFRKLYAEPSIWDSYQISMHLGKWF
jgi:hypothetical protein